MVLNLEFLDTVSHFARSGHITCSYSLEEKKNIAITFLTTSLLFVYTDHSVDLMAMDVAVNAVAGALKAFFADLPDPLIPYSLHPELVEAASKYIYSRFLRTLISEVHLHCGEISTISETLPCLSWGIIVQLCLNMFLCFI